MLEQEGIYSSDQHGNPNSLTWDSRPGEELIFLDNAIFDLKKMMQRMGL